MPFECRRVITQNKKYYSRFPQDVAKVQRLVLYLNSQPGGGVRLPRGGVLTPRGVQLLGMTGLGSAGGFERLHFLLERIFDGPSLSLNFLIVRPHFCYLTSLISPARKHTTSAWLPFKSLYIRNSAFCLLESATYSLLSRTWHFYQAHPS